MNTGRTDNAMELSTPPRPASLIPRFLKVTRVGGFLFMAPLILLVVVLRRGVELAGRRRGATSVAGLTLSLQLQ